MKDFFTLCFIMLFPFFVIGSVIDNFNRAERFLQGNAGQKVPPWWTWHSKGEPAPIIRFTDDAAEGTAAMELTIPKSRGTQFIGRLCKIPPSCNALSLWVRCESGIPNCFIVFESDPKRSSSGIKRFGIRLPVPADRHWNRIILPFSELKFLNHEKTSEIPRFDSGMIGTVSFNSFNNPAPFTIKVDNIEFISSDSESNKSETSVQSPNLLGGDTSFETGIGNWIVIRDNGSTVPLWITDRDGAIGSSSLCISPATGTFCSDCSNVLHKGVPYTLSFFVKSEKPDQLSCLIANSRWTPLASRVFHTSSKWERVSLTIPAQPTDVVCNIIFAQAPRLSKVKIDAVQLEKGITATPYRQSGSAAVNAVTGEPGEIVLADPAKTVDLEIRIANFSIPSERLPLSLQCRITGLTGNEVTSISEMFSLKIGETVRRKFTVLPASVPGYYPVELTVRDAKGALVAYGEAPFAVVEPVSNKMFPDSFFGIHPGYMPLTALRRIGVKWIRSGIEWLHAEPIQGKFNMKIISERRNYAALGMMELCTLANPPVWARGNGGQPEYPGAIMNFLARTLETVGDSVACYELDNEPDLKRNTSPVRYAEWLQTVHPAVRKVGKKLLFGCSGEGEEFAKSIFLMAAKNFDIYGPHPYTSPRYLGPVAGPAIGPEKGNLAERLKAAQTLIRQYGDGHELWIGELGWGIDRSARFDDSYAKKHAEFLARAFLIARNNPAVKRLIWFTALGVLEEKRYEYGLWSNRNGLRPRPAAAAYATLSALLDGAKPLEPLCDSEIKAYVFQQKNGGLLVAAWDSSEYGDDPVNFDVFPHETAIRTMTGNHLDSKESDCPVTVSLTGSPLYFLLKSVPLSVFSRRLSEAVARRRPMRISVATPDTHTLRLRLCNNLPARLSGSVILKAGKNSPVPLSFSLNRDGCSELGVGLSLSLLPQGTPVRFTVKTEKGKIAEFSRNLPAFFACPRFSGKNFLQNGLAGKPAFILNRREQVLPADPAVGWNSPQDLSAMASIAWDEQYFYFDCTVVDPVFCQPFFGKDIWKGDCVQLAFDGGCDAFQGGYNHNDSEFGLAYTPKGPLAWRWYAPAGKMTGKTVFPLRIIREGRRTSYRAAIPWKELMENHPYSGKLFGFNFIAGNNNGYGRNYWIGLTPGIAEGKKPELFLKFVLTE